MVVLVFNTIIGKIETESFLRDQGQPHPNTESQASQKYIIRACFLKKEQKKETWKQLKTLTRVGNLERSL